jgi:hypothetical protein
MDIDYSDSMDLDPPAAAAAEVDRSQLEAELQRLLSTVDDGFQIQASAAASARAAENERIRKVARNVRQRLGAAAAAAATPTSSTSMPTPFLPDVMPHAWSTRPQIEEVTYPLHPELAALLPLGSGKQLATSITCDLPLPLRCDSEMDQLCQWFGRPGSGSVSASALLVWLLAHSAYDKLTTMHPSHIAGRVFMSEATHEPMMRAQFHPPLGPDGTPPQDRLTVRFRYPLAWLVHDMVDTTPGGYADGASLKLMAALSLFALFPCPAEPRLPRSVRQRLANIRCGDVQFLLKLGAPVQLDQGIDWATVWQPTPAAITAGVPRSLLDAMSAAFAMFQQVGPTAQFVTNMRWLYETAMEWGDPAQGLDMTVQLGTFRLPFGW